MKPQQARSTEIQRATHMLDLIPTVTSRVQQEAHHLTVGQYNHEYPVFFEVEHMHMTAHTRATHQ